MGVRSAVSIAAMGLLALQPAFAAREAVLKQIQLPHNYYFREMLLPQLTSGPSSVAFSPDGKTLVYSMAGSLWRQAIGADVAHELTRGPGYDYQPDWSPDGRHIVFTRHNANAIQIVRLDVATGKELQLTGGSDVNLQPRYSPDGRQLAYVSTKDTGHFNLFVAQIADQGLSAPKFALPPRESAISRYYYSTYDHSISPSWTPDGKRVVFVSNREIAYGSGSLCVAEPGGTAAPICFNNEETSWRAQPEVGPDGDRVLYSSYQGRQWHQLWLTTLSGDATLPLTFGDFDITQARWSPDGRRIAYVSNEEGNLSLWVQEVVGGKRTMIRAVRREHRGPVALLKVRITDASGKNVPGRLSVVGPDARAYAPVDAWVHADDGFDPQQQREETRYFHCFDVCEVEVPAGDVAVTAWRGQQYAPAHRTIKVRTSDANELALRLEELRLPAWAPHSITADMHVHMNYGGHYRSELQTLARQARAENLDVVYNTIVNKEQRVPDVSLFTTKPFVDSRTIVYQSQEYHTSFWGHMALLHLDDHYLTPGFSAYQHSALTSPYPHNGVIADLAHAQNAIVGYVHPYDWPIVPEKEKTLAHTFPADVALGKADYVEVVGFADHKSTAEVWYRLLNLGFRVPTGSGTDAMTNYASLRGPVGMNRAYLHTDGATTPAALKAAVKAGRTVASNGPQLALQIEQRNIGDVISLPAGKHRLRYRASMRSIVPIEHLEIVQNGRVVASHRFDRDRTRADMQGEIDVEASGWVVLRVWNEGADPLILDLYPYATTSPIYIDVAGQSPKSSQDAQYFLQWMDRVIDAAEARDDYNDNEEKEETLKYLGAAREVFRGRL